MTNPAYTLHPRNRDFVWRTARLDRLRRITAEQARHFDDEGFIVLRDAFDTATLDTVEAAIDPLEREHDRRLRTSEGCNAISSADAVTFTTHLVSKSDVLRRFAAHPVIADVCHDLIGDDVRLYWDQSVYKKSGKPQEFPWHQDNGYTFVEPQQYLTFWLPLVDADVDNGCPWVAPRLHKLGTLKHWATPIGLKCLDSVADAVPAEARRGDVVIFSSLTPHRTGPNLKADSVRKAYILQYAPDGAEAISAGGSRIAQSDPDRQFLILTRK